MLLRVQGQREVVREGNDAAHELNLNLWHHIVWMAPLALIPYFCVGREAFKLAPPDNRCVFQWCDVAKLQGKVTLHALVNPSTQLAIVNGALIYGLSVPIVERLRKHFRNLVGGGYLPCYAISIPSALMASPDFVQMAVDLAFPPAAPAAAPAAAATAGWIGYLDPLGIGRYSYKFVVGCFWSPASPIPNNAFVPFCAGNAGAVYGLLAANLFIAVDNAYNDAVTEGKESSQQKSDDGKPEEEQSSQQKDAQPVAPVTTNDGRFWKTLKKRMPNILLPVASSAAYFYFQRNKRGVNQERTLDFMAMRGAGTGAVMACVLLGGEGFLANGGAVNTITYLRDQMGNLLRRTMGRFRRPVENVVNLPSPVPNAVDATSGNSLKI
eukprot:gene25810-31170_t